VALHDACLLSYSKKRRVAPPHRFNISTLTS
jgi:hypothetical protein